MHPATEAPSAMSSDFEFAALGEARNYRRALLRSFAPRLRGRVLEIGAGIGQMTRELLTVPAVTELVSVEPDARFTARLQAILPPAAVIRGFSGDVPPPARWDTLISINVLEHIEADEAELARYRALLSPQHGHLCLFVPACPGLYAPIDRDFGHFRRYSRGELRDKLVRAGFTVEELHYYNLPGYFAWLASFRILRSRSFNARTVRWFDRLVFPATYWCESRLFRPPFGQSLLAIARA